MTIFKALPLTLLLLTLPALLLAQDQSVAGVGHIDWVGGQVVATGLGAPPPSAVNRAQARASARRAAMLDARRNLLEVVGEVRIEAQTLVRNVVVESDVVASRVSGLLRRSHLLSEEILADGTVQVQMAVPLAGELSRAVISPPSGTPSQPRVAALEQRIRELEAENKSLRQPGGKAPLSQDLEDESPKPLPLLSPEQSAALDTATGLVIDARGTQFSPSIKPRIMKGSSVLYPGDNVDYDIGLGRGFVRYFRDVTQAQQSDLAGPSPRTIKAQANGADLIVSDADAALLENAMARKDSFLNQCKVVVVF